MGDKTAQEHDADMFFGTVRMEALKTDWEYRLARFHRLLGPRYADMPVTGEVK